jgi:protein gp37
MAHNPNPKIAAANAGLVVFTGAGLNWTGRVNVIEGRLGIPLGVARPTSWFVDSLSDLFHPEVHSNFIARVFGVMKRCPQHRFTVLTKQAERMCSLLTRVDPIPGVRLGVSAENQAMWDLRVPFLQRTPAWQRIVSVEPMLEPVEMRGISFLNQIIFGGDSGSGACARPLNLRWIRNGIRQCRTFGIAPFVKQLGSRPGVSSCADIDCTHPDCGVEWLKLRSRKGGDILEWPEDLRVREWPA